MLKALLNEVFDWLIHALTFAIFVATLFRIVSLIRFGGGLVLTDGLVLLLPLMMAWCVKRSRASIRQMALEGVEGTSDEVGFRRFLHLRECEECQNKRFGNAQDLENPEHEIDSCPKFIEEGKKR